MSVFPPLAQSCLAWCISERDAGCPQPGNERPRLFRLPEHRALINRLGFNNKGVDHLVRRVRRHRFKGILGINIGKNFDTPIEKAANDYLIGLRKVYAHASYVAINISSPNTKNLRQLQGHASIAFVGYDTNPA